MKEVNIKGLIILTNLKYVEFKESTITQITEDTLNSNLVIEFTAGSSSSDIDALGFPE